MTDALYSSSSPSSSSSIGDDSDDFVGGSHSRHVELDWLIPLGGVVHGFVGFFQSRLYKDVVLSTLPDRSFSQGMYSWFPIFFPLRVSASTLPTAPNCSATSVRLTFRVATFVCNKTPLNVASGSHLHATMWRRTSARKVWYEWAMVGSSSGAATAATTALHNPGGRSSYIAL